NSQIRPGRPRGPRPGGGLGDRDDMPATTSDKLDGYLLNPDSRSTCVIAVDRANDVAWLMGRIIPLSALAVERSRSPGAGARLLAGSSLVAGAGFILGWSADAGDWSSSDGG